MTDGEAADLTKGRYADSHEAQIYARARAGLTDRQGRTMAELRKLWSPRWGLVWLSIGGGLAVLLVAAVLAVTADRTANDVSRIVTAPLLAVVIGGAVAFLALWFHEASHFNVCSDRRWNDRLANGLIGTLVGQDIERYRKVHFEHHRYLGSPADPENSYFLPLGWGFILMSLSGLLVFRVIANRDRSTRKADGGSYLAFTVVRALLVHGAILALAVGNSSWVLLVAWFGGFGAIFPLLGALRQLLEHRSEQADNAVDYSRVPHGALSRNFGTGLLSSVLGGAGFNRHLLHHWEPQISATRFADFEAIVLDSEELAPFYRSRTTTYPETLRSLFHG